MVTSVRRVLFENETVAQKCTTTPLLLVNEEYDSVSCTCHFTKTRFPFSRLPFTVEKGYNSICPKYIENIGFLKGLKVLVIVLILNHKSGLLSNKKSSHTSNKKILTLETSVRLDPSLGTETVTSHSLIKLVRKIQNGRNGYCTLTFIKERVI